MQRTQREIARRGRGHPRSALTRGHDDSGRHVWQELALPKISAYYGRILEDLSINDVAHALHYLLKMLQNMQRLDQEWVGAADDDGEALLPPTEN